MLFAGFLTHELKKKLCALQKCLPNAFDVHSMSNIAMYKHASLYKHVQIINISTSCLPDALIACVIDSPNTLHTNNIKNIFILDDDSAY